MKKAILLLATATALSASSASAQSIAHRWDMSSTMDIIGSANGTLGAGAILSGGVLTGTGGAGNPGGGTGNGLNLPTLAVAGLDDSFSIEVWYTWTGTPGYQTLFAFSDGTTENYLINVADRGNAPGNQSSAFKVAGGETYVQGPANATNTLTQMVVTYDGNTNASIYVNGVFANSISNINPNFDLSTFTQLGIAGNSPWGDAVLSGSVSDFRIYEGVLSGDQISTLNGLGADATNGEIIAAVPEPATLGLIGLGAAAVLLRRRRKA